MTSETGRSSTPEERAAATFAEAWINCMTVHDATLASGPCDRCVVEYGRRLTDDARSQS